jgi:hypothetical protein
MNSLYDVTWGYCKHRVNYHARKYLFSRNTEAIMYRKCHYQQIVFGNGENAFKL